MDCNKKLCTFRAAIIDYLLILKHLYHTCFITISYQDMNSSLWHYEKWAFSVWWIFVFSIAYSVQVIYCYECQHFQYILMRVQILCHLGAFLLRSSRTTSSSFITLHSFDKENRVFIEFEDYIKSVLCLMFFCIKDESKRNSRVFSL